MNGLYPIIRRVRRPLLPVEPEAPKPAAQPSEPPKNEPKNDLGSDPKTSVPPTDSTDASANANN